MVQRTGLPCAIMFVDVCGTSDLIDTLGNARAQAATASLQALASSTAERHSGKIIKTTNTQVMCVFATPDEAATAAVATQQAASGAIQTQPAAVRIGFHYGPVIHHEADVFGDAVNMAARVLSHAKPGQILLTSDTAQELQQSAGELRLIGATHVKGKAQPVNLLELMWEHENVTKANSRLNAKSADVHLIARFGQTTLELCSTRPVLQMGRAESNDFVVPGPLVSRLHARIEQRRSRFYLVDQSSNGTFLRLQGQPEIMLRRDEAVLTSSGLISLGMPTSDASQLCLHFTLRSGPAR
jgi:adenylate cyclase